MNKIKYIMASSIYNGIIPIGLPSWTLVDSYFALSSVTFLD